MNKITSKNINISNRTRKGVFSILLIIFLVFINTSIVHASFSFGKFFGGKITNPKSFRIQELESTGYICPMYGTSISIYPKGSSSMTPTEFFIPSYVTPATRTTPMTGQQMLGIYSGMTSITCTRPQVPAPDIQIVYLPSITLFGTSRY